MAGKLILKRGKEKPLLNRHPWIFSGAIASVQDAQDGDTVEVYSAGGEWLARAAYNSRSQIAARVWTFDRDEPIDHDFFTRRIKRASEFRRSLFENWNSSGVRSNSNSQNQSFRLVNAESDGLPGVVLDPYADFVVAQFLTLGADRFKQEIVSALSDVFRQWRNEVSLRGIYERSDVDVRRKEGLAELVGVLAGAEPPDCVEIQENGYRFQVDVKRGHKTGFYLDQRENRLRAESYLRGEVLNAFAYTGAFGVYAAKSNDARVVNLDASAPSLELARKNFSINALEANAEYVVGDAFEKLREFRSAGRRFDAIILDPPKFVTSQSNLERALRAYKDLNLLAFQLVRPEGFVVTFSCSGLVSPELFQKVVFGAAVDARRDAQIIEKLSQSPDHPISLAFPEAEYLKGLIVRVL